MKKVLVWVCFLFLCLYSLGCSKVVVRDAKVYKQELGFVDAASSEAVERGKVVIAEECTCEEVGGVIGFATKACNGLAETILVIEARSRYHTDMARFLSGMTKERPPKEPPEIPDTNTLCPKKGVK